MFENAKATKLQRLTAIPVETYVNTFAEMSLEATNPALAAEIRVDGKMFMVREGEGGACEGRERSANSRFGKKNSFSPRSVASACSRREEE